MFHFPVQKSADPPGQRVDPGSLPPFLRFSFPNHSSLHPCLFSFDYPDLPFFDSFFHSIIQTSPGQGGGLPPPLPPSWTPARPTPQTVGHPRDHLFSMSFFTLFFDAILATLWLQNGPKIDLKTIQNPLQNLSKIHAEIRSEKDMNITPKT